MVTIIISPRYQILRIHTHTHTVNSAHGCVARLQKISLQIDLGIPVIFLVYLINGQKFFFIIVHSRLKKSRFIFLPRMHHRYIIRRKKKYCDTNLNNSPWSIWLIYKFIFGQRYSYIHAARCGSLTKINWSFGQLMYIYVGNR